MQGVRMLLRNSVRDHQKTRMGLKIRLSLFSLCLSAMFGDCSGENSTSLSLITSGSSHQPTTATAGPTPAYTEEDVTSVLTTQETSPAKQNETNTPEEATNATTQAPSPSSVTQSTSRRSWDPSWDDPFQYDYSVLRHVGLCLAAALFLMGIAIMTCGRVCRTSRCHVRQGKSYRVTSSKQV